MRELHLSNLLRVGDLCAIVLKTSNTWYRYLNAQCATSLSTANANAILCIRCNTSQEMCTRLYLWWSRCLSRNSEGYGKNYTMPRNTHIIKRQVCGLKRQCEWKRIKQHHTNLICVKIALHFFYAVRYFNLTLASLHVQHWNKCKLPKQVNMLWFVSIWEFHL